MLGVSRAFAGSLQQRIERQTGIPAAHVRVCATHSHSCPALNYLRQWGAISREYQAQVEESAVQAVVEAQKDVAQTDLYLGKQRVIGGNYNRTAKQWRTDSEFAKDSGENERWLDTMLHALFFLRDKPKQSLLWYHFSAHPVCYTDTLAGPDWPGLVATKIQERDGYQPGFLQGHIGDVNPGDGKKPLGDPELVSEAVWTALHHATSHSEHVPVDQIEVVRSEFRAPFNRQLLADQLARYRKDPAACTSGEWVDAGFAAEWFESASRWPNDKTEQITPLSAIRLGSVALLFHAAELYSCYGLAVRRDSPFADTIVCGYADDFLGYVTDPKAYEQKEYAAVVVPKILDMPPFQPETGRQLVGAGLELLGRLGRPARAEL